VPTAAAATSVSATPRASLFGPVDAPADAPAGAGAAGSTSAAATGPQPQPR
jgi:hypothetical protein